jgi:uncharacterized protein YndB with AHSA1/START domain
LKEAVAYASFPLPMPQARESLPPATVQVSVFVPTSIEAVWIALTRRDEIRRWFGDLSDDLKLAGTVRLDFGDGDFFEIDNVELQARTALRYQWRFLGTGPRNTIAWSIGSEKGGVRVTVTDCEVSRSTATVEELSLGWTDFLRRLQVYCASGQNTRYTWRRQFDGSIELPASAEASARCLLQHAQSLSWLPWSGGLEPGTVVQISDGRKPEHFWIEDVFGPSPLVLRFKLGCSQWLAPTPCEIAIQTRPCGSLLVVSQGDWGDISADDGERSAQRHRFGELWIHALRQAAVLVADRC